MFLLILFSKISILMPKLNSYFQLFKIWLKVYPQLSLYKSNIQCDTSIVVTVLTAKKCKYVIIPYRQNSKVNFQENEQNPLHVSIVYRQNPLVSRIPYGQSPYLGYKGICPGMTRGFCS